MFIFAHSIKKFNRSAQPSTKMPNPTLYLYQQVKVRMSKG